MMTFREIEPEDREWVTGCRDPREHPFTALSFTSLFSWRITYGLTIAGSPDCFMIHSRHDQAYYAPCGDREQCEQLIREILREDSGARFLYLTREQAREMQKTGFHVLMRDDLSEYIFDTGSLALWENHHASNSYKMKVRHFQKDVPFSVRPVTERDIPLLNEIAKNSAPTSADDEAVLETEMAHFDLLGLQGCLLEAQGCGRAFILGYQDHRETFTLTMTRHEKGLPSQITAVLVHEMACRLAEQYRLINLEEDLGLAGLRRAKLLYSPVDRLNVYEAVR